MLVRGDNLMKKHYYMTQEEGLKVMPQEESCLSRIYNWTSVRPSGLLKIASDSPGFITCYAIEVNAETQKCSDWCCFLFFFFFLILLFLIPYVPLKFKKSCICITVGLSHSHWPSGTRRASLINESILDTVTRAGKAQKYC